MPDNLKQWALAFAQIFSLAVVGISLTGLIGHILRHPALYTWHGFGATAIPTATMLLLLAASVFLLSLMVSNADSAV